LDLYICMGGKMFEILCVEVGDRPFRPMVQSHIKTMVYISSRPIQSGDFHLRSHAFYVLVTSTLHRCTAQTPQQCNATPRLIYAVIIHSCPCPRTSRQTEPKSRHTTFIFINRTRAILLWVLCVAEEHAFVAGGFLVFAYAAWLYILRSSTSRFKIRSHIGTGGGWH